MMRLNKFLASAGIASRRKCDELIQAGKVKLNGELVRTLGVKIDEHTDVVEFENRPVKLKLKFVYILLNKPHRYVTTASDEHHRRTVLDLINIEERVFPVGRLDYLTTGALMLTDDGELSNRLIHPRFKVKKVYHFLLDKRIRPVDLYHVEHGIVLDDKKTMPCKAKEIRLIDNCSLVEITLREGRNRQIRRMMEKLGYTVEMLDRIAFGNLNLAGLKRGEWRYLTESEINDLKQEVQDGVER